MRICDSVADFFTRVGTIPISPEDIQRHINNKTILVLRDDAGIAAAARWMWIGNVIHILDVCVQEKYRGGKILKQMIEIGLERNPDCEAIAFDREVKYPRKEKTVIQVKRRKT